MITKVYMPKLGLTMERGQILNWRKQEGDTVEKGEPLFEIETDKINFVVEAQCSGVLRKILAVQGTSVSVGGLVATIATSAVENISQFDEEEVAENITEISVLQSATTFENSIIDSPKMKVTPRAKRLAKEKGVDLTLVRGSGRTGEILEKDVQIVLEAKGERKKIREKRPYLGIRKTIGERMSESIRIAPQFTINTDVRMDEVIAVHDEIVPKIMRAHNFKITYTEIIAKIVTEILKKYPLLNASILGDEVVLYESVNLGVAMATEQGLIVPVIFGAEKKSLIEIGREMEALTHKVKSRTLTPDDVKGGTFTISNIGMADVDGFTPIINPPESAILGIGKIKKRPTVLGEDIVVQNVMQLSLTVDHRIVDGLDAAKFIQDLKRGFEDPYCLLGNWKFGQGRAISDSRLLVKWQARRFRGLIDEPFDLGGTNEGANPVEVFMAAFASCFALMLKVAASARALNIERIEVNAIPESFERINRISFNLQFETQESKETIEKLVTIAEKLCPIRQVIRKDIPVDFNLEVKPLK